MRLRSMVRAAMLWGLLAFPALPVHAAQTHLFLTDFTAGELSPLMAARVDMAKFKSGAQELENWLIYPHGPITKRPGLRFVDEVLDSSGPARLVPFVYSVDDAYALELGEQSGGTPYIRFYTDGGQVVQDYADATDVMTGGDGEAADVALWTAAAGASLFSVAGGEAGNCFELREAGASPPWMRQDLPVAAGKEYRFRAYTKAGTEDQYTLRIQKMPAQIDLLASWYQIAPTAWGTAPDVDVRFDVPLGVTQIRVLFYQQSVVGSGTTIQFDSMDLKRTDEPYSIVSPYDADDLATLSWCQSADVMYLVHPDYDVYELARSGPTNWEINAISGASAFTNDPFTGANDYPCCCAFHENRLAFAGTNAEPDTIWLSKSGDFDDFTTGALDDDAMELTLASNQVNAVRWLVPSIYLTIGTAAGEWRLSATDPDEPITPTNVTAKRELVYGSSVHMPVHVGKDILFLQRDRETIRKLSYDWATAGYTAPDVTVLSEHVTRGGVSELFYQQAPFPVVWGVRADGVMPGLTYLPEHEVFAWSRLVTDGEIESAAVVPSGSQDQLYALVRRDIAGATRRFIEILDPPFDGDDSEDAFFVDAGLSYSGTPASSFTGLYHLAGTTVTALADGTVRSSVPVDATGAFTLPTAASEVHVGLPYTATYRSVPLEAPTNDNGTSQGRIKRISRAGFRLHRSANGQTGPDETNLTDILSGTTELATGDTWVDWPGGYEEAGVVTVVHDDPTPMTIRGIILKVTTGD